MIQAASAHSVVAQAAMASLSRIRSACGGFKSIPELLAGAVGVPVDTTEISEMLLGVRLWSRCQSEIDLHHILVNVLGGIPSCFWNKNG